MVKRASMLVNETTTLKIFLKVERKPPMIIGGSKKEVIKNIETNINNNELNKKVEVGDPNLTEEEKTKYINKFYQNQKVQYILSK